MPVNKQAAYTSPDFKLWAAVLAWRAADEDAGYPKKDADRRATLNSIVKVWNKYGTEEEKEKRWQEARSGLRRPGKRAAATPFATSTTNTSLEGQATLSDVQPVSTYARIDEWRRLGVMLGVTTPEEDSIATLYTNGRIDRAHFLWLLLRHNPCLAQEDKRRYRAAGQVFDLNRPKLTALLNTVDVVFMEKPFFFVSPAQKLDLVCTLSIVDLLRDKPERLHAYCRQPQNVADWWCDEVYKFGNRLQTSNGLVELRGWHARVLRHWRGDPESDEDSEAGPPGEEDGDEEVEEEADEKEDDEDKADVEDEEDEAETMVEQVEVDKDDESVEQDNSMQLDSGADKMDADDMDAVDTNNGSIDSSTISSGSDDEAESDSSERDERLSTRNMSRLRLQSHRPLPKKVKPVLQLPPIPSADQLRVIKDKLIRTLPLSTKPPLTKRRSKRIGPRSGNAISFYFSPRLPSRHALPRTCTGVPFIDVSGEVVRFQLSLEPGQQLDADLPGVYMHELDRTSTTPQELELRGIYLFCQQDEGETAYTSEAAAKTVRDVVVWAFDTSDTWLDRVRRVPAEEANVQIFYDPFSTHKQAEKSGRECIDDYRCADFLEFNLLRAVKEGEEMLLSNEFDGGPSILQCARARELSMA